MWSPSILYELQWKPCRGNRNDEPAAFWRGLLRSLLPIIKLNYSKFAFYCFIKWIWIISNGYEFAGKKRWILISTRRWSPLAIRKVFAIIWPSIVVILQSGPAMWLILLSRLTPKILYSPAALLLSYLIGLNMFALRKGANSIKHSQFGKLIFS